MRRRLDRGRSREAAAALAVHQVGELRMLSTENAERLLEHRQENHRGLRDDRGRPATRQEQADLAAELAGAEPGHDVAVLLDAGGSVDDHEQLVGEVSLLRNVLTSRDGKLVEAFGEPCFEGRGKGRQGRNGLDATEVDHAATLLCRATPRHRPFHLVTDRSPGGHILTLLPAPPR